MIFINPYNFVRVHDPVREHSSKSLSRVAGFSGEIGCRLRAITPLVVPAIRRGSTLGVPLDPQKRPFVPGAAVRGMVRSLFETLSCSCDPSSPEHCKEPSSCCLACRVFGRIAEEDAQGGLLRFTDAIGEPSILEPVDILLPREEGPRRHHRPFYYDDQRNPRGRKFYFHHAPRPDEWEPGSTSTRIRNWIRRDSELKFRIQFANLDEGDLLTLLYALVLEPGLGHKLGHGRPLGLGSCAIELDPEETRLESAPEIPGGLFMDFRHQGTVLPKDDLDDLVLAARNRLSEHPFLKETLEDVRIVLRLPGHQPGHMQGIPVRYPSRAWFWYDRRSVRKWPLPTLQDISGNRGMLSESPVGRVLRINLGVKWEGKEVLAPDEEEVALRLPDGEMTFSMADFNEVLDDQLPEDLRTFIFNHTLLVEVTQQDPLRGRIRGIENYQQYKTD
ncbi:MAG: RAMP superfamily CRISPR-associated protein [Desulfatiglandales bacterium]